MWPVKNFAIVSFCFFLFYVSFLALVDTERKRDICETGIRGRRGEEGASV